MTARGGGGAGLATRQQGQAQAPGRQGARAHFNTCTAGMALLYTHKHTYVSTVCSGLHLIQLTLERDLTEVSRGVVREFWQTTHTHINTRRRSDSLWERVLPQQGIQPPRLTQRVHCRERRAASRAVLCTSTSADGPGEAVRPAAAAVRRLARRPRVTPSHSRGARRRRS